MLQEEQVRQMNREEFQQMIKEEKEWMVDCEPFSKELFQFLITKKNGMKDRLEKIKITLEENKVQQRFDSNTNKAGTSYLGIASMSMDYPVMKCLIEFGVDVNYKQSDNRSALIDLMDSSSYISLKNDKEQREIFINCLQLLLNSGADINIVYEELSVFNKKKYDIVDIIEKQSNKKELYELFSPYKEKFTEEKRKKFAANKMNILFD